LLVALLFGGPAAALLPTAGAAQPLPAPATSGPVPATAAEAYREARATVDRGETAEATEKVEAALKRFGSRDEDAVWALKILKGELLVNARSPEAVRVLLPPLPGRLSQSETEVWRLYNLAIYYERQTKERESVRRTIDRAYELSRTKQPQMFPRVLMAHSYIGRAKPDLAEVRESLRLAREAGDHSVMMKAEGTLGRLEALAQHFDKAIAHWQSVIEHASAIHYRGNTVEKTKGNLGWAYLELGNYEAAAELFQDANKETQSLKEKADSVPWLYQLGNLRFRVRDWAGANSYYEQAYELAVKLNHPDQGAILGMMARVRLGTRQFDEAQALIEKARKLETKRAGESDDPSLEVLEAQIATARGEYRRGEEELKRVISGTRNQPMLWQARGSLAQLYAKTGRRKEAAKQYALAMRTVQKARLTLPGASSQDIHVTELRLSFYNLVDELFGSYVDFLVDGGEPEKALAVTELSRAQTLEEGVGLRTGKGEVDPREASRRAGAPILCYWLARERSYLWVVTPKSVKVVKLAGQPAIEAEIDRYQNELRGSGDPLEGIKSARGSSGQKLYSMLLEPAALRLDHGARVVVIPAARLSVLNMETLIVPTLSPHYWLEDAVVTTASSIRLLARGPKPPPAPADASMLLVGNPRQVVRNFPGLPKAHGEMDNVAAHFRKRVRLEGADANPKNYRLAKPGHFDFIHFVAHGVASRTLPLESAVILDRAGDSEGSYKLYARDIVGQPLRARLVTISSCHGAGTSAYTGEGLVGLAWAFLRAGSRQVIAALWEVNDNATPELMDNLYGGIQQGQDVATALHHAKLKMLRSGSIKRLPRYWAPFVLYEGS